MFALDHCYHIQKGSAQTLRVADENKFYIIEEVWERNTLLDSKVVYAGTQAECQAELKKLS